MQASKQYGESKSIVRYPSNPIITAHDMPFECDRVYNAAACRQGDDICLLLRCEKADYSNQCLGLARSKDGIHFTIHPAPVMTPSPEERGRLNDPRVTFIDGWYYLCYCSDPGGAHVREEGVYLCMARSTDLLSWERFYRSLPDNRNAVLFPEKINGLYCRLERPFRRGYRQEHGYDIWISYSPDMVYWGEHKLLLSHYDVDWGHHKIGPACPPFLSSRGWVCIFHGAEIPEDQHNYAHWTNKNMAKVYRAGVMLLDYKDPSKIISRRKLPLLEPVHGYEMDPAYRPYVVFPTGAIPEADGSVKIYYGASDTTVCLATANVEELARLC